MGGSSSGSASAMLDTLDESFPGCGSGGSAVMPEVWLGMAIFDIGGGSR
jgi:hypothetical protein